MFRFASSLLALAMAGSAFAAEPVSWFAGLLSPELRRLDQQRAALEGELAALGTPVVGQTVEQFGYQHPRLTAPPLIPAWVQIDLGTAQPLDWIALVPAQLDWQSFDRPAYGFPKRFRIDVSDDAEFRTFATVADFTEADFPEPGVSPVSVPVGGRSARYVRVTVTKLAIDNEQHFFALAEILTLVGNRNVAIGRPVSVSGRYELKPRWSPQNLVDGRTPLGPPIRKELLGYDGLYVDTPATGEPPIMQVDLERAVELQEVRLHPVHARLGADVPGFAFAKSFRIEAAQDAAFTQPVTLFETADFPNPGNNPVTIPLSGVAARAVRLVFLGGNPIPLRRYGLSELEIYAGGENVARLGAVTASPDHSNFSKDWPRASLIDGFTSYGRLTELPQWLESWNRRRELQAQLGALAAQRPALEQAGLKRGLQGLGMVAAASMLGAVWLVVRSRRRRRREMEALRLRLARDLHDEIGSNLAGVAVLSEMAAESDAPDETREDWREVNRITHESIDSMREVLWVLGARQEAGIDLLPQLQRAAARMLPGYDVIWRAIPAELPTSFSSEARRQLFLFFKEALANLARHAGAKHVELSLQLASSALKLEIRDDGCGFDPATVQRGTGLISLAERARTLRGQLRIESTPGQGTIVTLHLPV